MSLPLHLALRKPILRPDDLEDLVRRSRDGDVGAFDHLIGMYYEVTFHLASRMLGDRDAAEDATQEIIIKAWRNVARFRGTAQFSTWLHAIAVNHCLTVAKRLARDLRRTEPLDVETVSDPTATAFRSSPASFSEGPDWEVRFHLRERIADLPEKLRVVITLHYFAEYSIREMADALDLPASTVQSRLSSALSRLGKSLDRMKERP